MRNSKFLLLLAVLLSGILGVYFIGCEGDTITNETEQPPDRVIGSVHGVISDAFDNMSKDSVAVSWVNNGQTHTVYTDTLGYFVTTGVLGSGEFEFTFSLTNYATFRTVTNIPDIEDLRGEPGTPVSGDIPFSRDLNLRLFPLNASLEGYVYTAPLGAPSRDNSEPRATDDPPDPVSPVGGVTVILDYSGWDTVYTQWWDTTLIAWLEVLYEWNIAPNKYVTITDQNGYYSFTDVPWVPYWVSITTQPFSVGDSSYSDTTLQVNLVHNGTATQPNIYAPLNCTDPPYIMSKNYSSAVDFHYDSNLVVTFTKAMDTLSFGVILNPVCDTPWTVSLLWTSGAQVLTINPVMTLLTDEDYELTLSGQSRYGCPLATVYDGFTVLDGIRLLTTNFERAPGQYDSVSIDSVLRLNFDMVPVVSQLYGYLTLYDITAYPDSYAVAFTSSVVNNSVVLDPSDSLERNHTYRLAYYILSNVQGDYVSGTFTFYTELFDQPPGAVGGFALDVTLTPTNSIDFDTREIYFRWNTVALVSGGNSGYKIFAKDNYRNSDFIQIWDIAARDYLQYQNNDYITGNDTMYALPTQFDFFLDDAIQTPFSGGTQVTFAIKAYNSAGDGPMSAGLTFGDVVDPSFTISQTYSADNTVGTSNRTVVLTMGAQTEYVATSGTPTFTFTEAGGDESDILADTDVSWTWNNAYRKDLTAYITVPAGRCGAGDMLRVAISDNSGNTGTYTFRLMPYINITNPVDTTSDFEAPSHNVTWTIAQASGATQINWVDYMVTFDGGATMVDSVPNFGSGTSGNTVSASIDDTLYSPTARVGIMDHTGGNIWWSDVFTHNGIEVTGPDSTYDTLSLIYDAEGTDSTKVPITWGQAGIDSVVIWYREDGSSWRRYDSLAGSAGAYNFWAPDFGYDWDCVVKVAAIDDGEPYDTLDYEFSVVNDYIDITAPASGTEIEGGANYPVVWTYVGESTQDIIVEYSNDGGTTWTTLATTKNDGAWTWPVSSNMPAHPGDGYLRFRDSNDLNTIATSDPFSVSGLTITTPVGGEEWLVGRADTIFWDTFNLSGVGNVNLYYSINGWTDSTLIASGETNNGFYVWSVDAPPSTTAQVSISGVDHNVVDRSDSNFTICGVTVTAPNGGEVVAQGAGFTIQWTTIGTLIDSVELFYDTGGVGWELIDPDTNDGTYAWAIPNWPSTNVKVKVARITDGLGSDVSDAFFTISGLKVTQPNGLETFSIGSTYPITWTRIGGLSGMCIIEYSTNSGADWTPIAGAGSVDPAAETWSWTISGTVFDSPPYTNCRIRIRDNDDTPPISDASDADFTIQ